MPIAVSRFRPRWLESVHRVPFCVEGISHSLDLERQTRTTQLTCAQVSIWMLGPLVTPPYPAPANI